VALREIEDDGSRDRLRAVYTPVVLFCVFSSVLAHGITIPIAKLGPHVVKRTTSFSAQRSISFTTRPGNRSTPSSGSSSPPSNAEREIWNPLYSLVKNIEGVALFWRKDSFWRKENEHQKSRKIIHSDNISKPMEPKKMDEIPNEKNGEEEAPSSESADEEAASSSQTRGDDDVVVQVTVPKAVAHPKDKESAGGRSDFIHNIEERIRKEWLAERNEAVSEVNGKSRQHNLQDLSAPSSAPGTPGGTRIRWQDES
jgi:hypothetical protein